jgi:class 3 adenylate cyclase
MANPEHLKILHKGVNHWNQWRKENPEIEPDLSKANLNNANLCKANLNKANLFDAKLGSANLNKANLSGADLRLAFLHRADLREALLNEAILVSAILHKGDFRGANLSEADLTGANLLRANLLGANLTKAKLSVTNLINSTFAQTILTDAKLWETQRSGWQIKGVICERIYWDEEGKEATEYAPGEFERAFSEKPKIVLNYPQGISEVEFAMLPLVLKKLQEQHRDCNLNIQSILDEGNGATITITVEDNTDRDPEVFKKEKKEITNKLEGVQKNLEIERIHNRISQKQIQSLKSEVFHLTHPEHDKTEKLTVLFLDIKHFSRMSEDQQQDAVTILGSNAYGLVQTHNGKYTNTWGDAIVVGFEDPNLGLKFACKLIQHLKLDELKSRIGMSYGNFTIKNDLLQGGLNPKGTAMSEGARLESFADEGEVLISPVLRHHADVDENCFTFTEVMRKVKKAFAEYKVGDELTCYTVSLK